MSSTQQAGTAAPSALHNLRLLCICKVAAVREAGIRSATLLVDFNPLGSGPEGVTIVEWQNTQNLTTTC